MLTAASPAAGSAIQKAVKSGNSSARPGKPVFTAIPRPDSPYSWPRARRRK